MRKKIETAPYLEKDDVTKAILNTDVGALNAYRRQREVLLRANNSQKEIQEIKTELGEIKSMMTLILSSLNNK